MPELTWQVINPEMVGRQLAEALRRGQENKYAWQVGLTDLDFEVDEDKARILGMPLPFQSVDQAEQALQQGVIQPALWLEEDQTPHRVIVFDPTPVGFSGFMGCVTHCLALTDHGLFQVGRYAAMSLERQNRHWQWFLHRQLATAAQVAAFRGYNQLSAWDVVGLMFEALTGTPARRSE